MGSRVVPVTKPCNHCGAPVVLKKQRDFERKKYCSHACRQRARYAERPWDMSHLVELSRGLDKRPVTAKACQICGTSYLPTSARQLWCTDCCPDKTAQRRIQRYGISEPALQKMLQRQAHLCAVCGIPLSRATVVVDHDHACCPVNSMTCGKCIRGLLCNHCNIGLHYVERPGWLAAALRHTDHALS